jgi:aminoglycoside phosphotransferase (APT) family kinase protein
MTGGRSNALYRVRRASGDDAVLRICLGDRNRFRRECALLQRFAGRLPIPRVTLADCEALPNGYFIYDYIMGSAFKVLAKTLDDESIGPAAEAAGWAIAQAGLQSPQDDARPFRADPFLEANDAENVPQFLAACAKSRIFAKRVGSETIAALARLVEAWTPQLLALTSQKALVHGDCSRSNVLVGPSHEGWDVARLIDWEFAAAGSPLIDVGHFFRYDGNRPSRIETRFAAGFRAAGGTLPDDWQGLARLADLAALAGGLTKPYLPDGAVQELCTLLRATLEVYPHP